jgi:hypothetical protein
MAVSEDESMLYVGSYAGGLHQLKLYAGHRDNHTIGTGKHYEECLFTIIFLRVESITASIILAVAGQVAHHNTVTLLLHWQPISLK